MKTFLIFFIWSSLFMNIYPQQKNNDELNSLIAVEYSFAKSASEIGTRDAFLKFIADDGILFRPNAVNGKKFLEQSAKKPGLLRWYPVHAEIALAGDMGFTTGPADFRNEKEGEPVWFGNFCTVWQRQENGEWKFVIDFGNSNNKPEEKAEGLKYSEPDKKPDARQLKKSNLGVDELIAAEKEFNNAVKNKGVMEAYKKYISAKTKILRNRYLPIIGTKNIMSFLEGESGSMNFAFEGGKISSSADLGFTYGKFEGSDSSGNINVTCNYLRIYKKEGSGWKIAIEALDKK